MKHPSFLSVFFGMILRGMIVLALIGIVLAYVARLLK